MKYGVCGGLKLGAVAAAAGYYNGRISIEGKIPQPETELDQAIRLMRNL